MSGLAADGATVVITHRVRSDSHGEYERWLGKIGPVCRAAPGHLDWHVVRPIAGLTDTFTVIIRFATTEHLRNWMMSRERAKLIADAQPLFAGTDESHVSSGLDFWFVPAGAKAQIPVRWKQYLITWSAIFPLAVAVPYLVSPVLGVFGVEESRLLTSLAVTGVVVFLMVYVVMPRYTRAVRRWLFA